MIRAVLGGSFDPVHRGHVAVAARLLSDGLAEEVRVVPAGHPPHKAPPVAGGPDRLTLLAIAFAGLPGTIVDDREIRRPGPSYTVDTLEDLAAAYPADRLRLVIGADHADGFARWHRPRRILELADLVLVRRGRGPAADPRSGLRSFLDTLAAAGLTAPAVLCLADFDDPVSSAQVRAMLGAGIDPAGLLPPGVGAAIATRGLYGG